MARGVTGVTRFKGGQIRAAEIVRDWVANTRVRVAETAAGVAQELADRTIDRTPVLTGHLKRNWQVGVNYRPGGHIGGTDPDGGATKAEIAASLEGMTAGDKIFLVNNAPYAAKIEFEGWSKKAPMGMLRISVAEIPQIIETVKRRLRAKYQKGRGRRR